MVRKLLLLKFRMGSSLDCTVKSDLVSVSWEFALSILTKNIINSRSISVVIGTFLDVETIIVSKDVFNCMEYLISCWKILICLILIFVQIF